MTDRDRFKMILRLQRVIGDAEKITAGMKDDKWLIQAAVLKGLVGAFISDLRREMDCKQMTVGGR